MSTPQIIEAGVWLVPAMGEESFLGESGWIVVMAAVAVVTIAIVIALVHRSRKATTHVRHEECSSCGSVNVQHRAGLAVCMDCGHSVHATAESH